MPRSIEFAAKPVVFTPIAFAGFLGLSWLYFYALGLRGGIVMSIFTLVLASWISRKRYLSVKNNPILLDFEGIHCNRMKPQLGADCLPWSDVSEIAEYKVPKSGLCIQIKLAQGLYYENWRESNLVNRVFEPSYLIDATPYNAEYKDMLYSLRSFHEKHGINVPKYESLTGDPRFGKASSAKLVAGAIFGYGMIIYALATGGFPVSFRQAIYYESSPLFYWAAILSFFAIANYLLWDVYLRYKEANANNPQQNDDLTGSEE